MASGISSVGPGLAGVQLAAQLQAATLSLAKDALELEGQAALRLIQSATVDADVGGNLNVQV